MKVLVTGSAGFIGYHLARRLLVDGHDVLGYDGLTPYYDVALKAARHKELEGFAGFRAVIGMLEDADFLVQTIVDFAPDIVLHLAAQAGVRHSLEHPAAYISANLVGSFNLLEAVRRAPPRHLLIASTSSVYGGNPSQPFAEADRADFPLSIYAATKSGVEQLSHAYAHLYGIPTTLFRFFTVYGPWGRPDMALFRFAEAIEAGRPIEIYGNGQMARDFTFIDDLVEAVNRLIDQPPIIGKPIIAPGIADSLSPAAPWRTVNIGGGQPVALLDFVAAVETAMGKATAHELLPIQAGDVPETRADTALLEALIGYLPTTPIDAGIAAFVTWYRDGLSRA